MSKPKRKYNKKSAYWDKLSQRTKVDLGGDSEEIGPVMCGDNYYVSNSSVKPGKNIPQSSSVASSISDALRAGGTSTSGTRFNRASSGSKKEKYKNISEGMLPYDVGVDGVDIRDSIELCQKAYANIPIFRNAVDVMSEFSNSEIYLEGGSESAKNFIYKWFEKINLWKLKDQYFREYYRSGNIFFYRIDGEFKKEDVSKFNKVYGDTKFLDPGKIPLRYILLNPYDMVSTRSTSFEGGVYKKMLSEYELERLRTPKTDEDEDIFESLDEETQDAIKRGGFMAKGVSVNLDEKRLIYSFYKKQDYEPFAIPFGYPVLDDLNWKIELKKIDQAISRTIENVVLLITMGAEPDKGGINPHSLGAMQCLFQNESVGRVLVSDYTTKADFIIPDVNKILGPQKYEIVNQDIREGLQNIIVGKENYSSTQIKAQIFLERLQEARNAFLNDFLMPQVKLVCQALGFRKYPTVKFQEVDIKDEIQFQRVITRLLEIGIISPEQGMSAIRTGLFPHPDSLLDAQKKYSEEREDGLYNPLVGGVPAIEQPGAEEERRLKEEQIKKAPKDSGEVNTAPPQNQKQGPPKESGRPTGATAQDLYSRKDLQTTIYDIEKLRASIIKGVKSKFSVKRLNSCQSDIVDKLIESIVTSQEKENWDKEVKACIKDPNKMESLQVIPGVLDISAGHQLSDYPSAILYHSKK
jgi:hypothetical protein